MKYDSILHHTRVYSAKHPPMSNQERAAQFAPFAALTGLDAAVEETARLTEQPVELTEEARQALTLQKLQTLPETDGNLVLFEDDLDANSPRALANGGMEKCAGICAVFTGSDKTGYRYVMGSKTVDLRAKAKQINTALQGKGGGQPTMIQGSLSADRAAIEAYFA